MADETFVFRFERACKRDEVRAGRGKIVHVGGQKLAIFLTEGQFYAIQNLCPHAGGSLGNGPCSGFTVRCPRHDWAFNLKSGRCITRRMYSARVYPVEVRGEYVYVGMVNS